MFFSTAVVLAGGASLVSAVPLTLTPRAAATFAAGSSWDILLNKGDSVGNIKQAVSANIQAIDIDLFDTDAATIAELKANKNVICYFSAGSKEGWRPDAGDFKDGDTGKGLDGWPDENWVNVKSENVRAIMRKRIQKAADNGCSAVDPDNVDGFDNGQDGFGYSKSDYVDYVKFLASEAASHGLAIGLKNAVDIIPDVINVVHFAVNEQCHQYSGECDKYKPFTDANKAIFNIEYGGNNCKSPSGVKLSTLIKPEDQALNSLGGACSSSGSTPTTGGNAAASSAASKTQGKPSSTPAPVKHTSAPAPAKSTSAPIVVPTKTAGGSKAPSSTLAAPKPTSTDTDDEGDDGDDGDDEPTSTPAHVPTSTSRPSRTSSFGRPTTYPKPSAWGSFHHHSHYVAHPPGHAATRKAASPSKPTPSPRSEDTMDSNEESEEGYEEEEQKEE